MLLPAGGGLEMLKVVATPHRRFTLLSAHKIVSNFSSRAKTHNVQLLASTPAPKPLNQKEGRTQNCRSAPGFQTSVTGVPASVRWPVTAFPVSRSPAISGPCPRLGRPAASLSNCLTKAETPAAWALLTICTFGTLT